MTEELEKQIRDLVAPHFGHVPLFKKWSKEVSFKKISEIHNYMKSHQSNIKLLSNPINSYSYYNVLSELLIIERETKLKRMFKDNLNGKSRKFFEKTFKDFYGMYSDLSNNDIKLKMFFRTSSKPQTMKEYIIYLVRIMSFNDDSNELIERIEDNFEHLITSNGGYLFKLEKEMLDIVPPTWCIYESETEYNREIKDRDLNSIWLLVDPFRKDETRMIVGIDVNEDKDSLLYMDTTNNRFTDNLPITDDEFFKITKDLLPREEKSLIHSIISSGRMERDMIIRDRERERCEREYNSNYVNYGYDRGYRRTSQRDDGYYYDNY